MNFTWEEIEEVLDSIREDFVEDKLEDDCPICIIAEIRTRLRNSNRRKRKA